MKSEIFVLYFARDNYIFHFYDIIHGPILDFIRYVY